MSADVSKRARRDLMVRLTGWQPVEQARTISAIEAQAHQLATQEE